MRTAKMKATTPDGLAGVLGTGRAATIGYATTVTREQVTGPLGQPTIETYLVIRLHGHPIVTWNLDGTVTLNDCGYQTETTKRHLNQFAPGGFGIWKERGSWYWRSGSNDVAHLWKGQITLNADGYPPSPVDPD